MTKERSTNIIYWILFLSLALMAMVTVFCFAQEEPPAFVPGEIIVKFKPGALTEEPTIKEGFVATAITSIDALAIKHNVTSMQKVFKQTITPKLTDIYKLALPEDANILAVAEEYKNDSNVEYAEPNYIYHTCETIPNEYPHRDALAVAQWGLDKIDAPNAWDIETGSSDVVIAIIDTGVDWDHPDLKNNMWINPGEDVGSDGLKDEDEPGYDPVTNPDPNGDNYDPITNPTGTERNGKYEEGEINNKDDDGNGYEDDIWGWDFLNEDYNPMDDHGHGTHCAGIASAVTNNATGIAGVCWNCKIMAIKFLSAQGWGDTVTAALGIVYAAERGAKVISMSWGGSEYCETLKSALDEAYKRGVILIAAAGNEYIERIIYPAAYDNVMAIAATCSDDKKAIFSSYGEKVDVCAPGGGVYSTLWNDAYGTFSGTSMSTPHVAGLAGLIYSANFDLTNEEVRTLIKEGADDIYDLNPGLVGKLGTGRINAAKSLQFVSDINISKYEIDDTLEGDGDGFLEPGEKANFIITLRSRVDATRVSAVLSSSEPLYVTIIDNSSDFGNIPAGGKADNQADPYVVEIDPSCLEGQRIIFSLELTATVEGEAYTDTLSFMMIISTYYRLDTYVENHSFTDEEVTVYINNRKQDASYAAPAKETTLINSFYAIKGENVIKIEWEENKQVHFNEVSLAVLKDGEKVTLIIPFYSEEFTTRDDKDKAATTALWDTQKGEVRLPPFWYCRPDWGCPTGHIYNRPALSDLDGDGDYDLLVGERYGVTYAFENTGNTSNPVWSRKSDWDIGDVGSCSSPALSDLDNDGDYDVLIGELGGNCFAFENTGNTSNPVWSRKSDWDVPSLPEGEEAKPTLADLDGDGDYDVLVGSSFGTTWAFENTGNTSNPVWSRKSDWDIGDVGFIAAPELADLDNDGDYDVLIGDYYYGNCFAFENTGNTSNPVWSRKSDWDVPSIGTYESPSPARADLDGDGDYDVLVGTTGDPIEPPGYNFAFENMGALTTAIAQSLSIIEDKVIIRATLTARDVIPEGTSIFYYLSADGGLSWEAVSNGEEHTFVSPRFDLRWRAVLTTNNPDTTPVIYNLSVDCVTATEPANPWITPPVPGLTTPKNTTLTYDLTPHERDVEDGPGADNNNLNWTISDVNSSLFSSASIDANDVLTMVPVTDALGSDVVTLTLTDSDNLTDTQDITVEIKDLSLVGYWPFSEGEGTRTTDVSGNGNDGNLLPTASEPTWVQGKYGYGLQFDGDNDYVDCGNNLSLDIINTISITAWIKIADPDQDTFMRIVSRKEGSWNSKGYELEYNPKLNTLTLLGSGDNYARAEGVDLDTNWHHVVGIANGGVGTLYVDGVDRTTDNTISPLVTTTAALMIGKQSTGSDYFKGFIDEVKIYNRVLTEEDITHPEIYPPVPGLTTYKNITLTYNLTPHENDIEDGPGADNNNLNWTISDVNSSLFSSASIDANDVLTMVPVTDALGSDVVTLTLTDSDGLTDAQDITATVAPWPLEGTITLTYDAKTEVNWTTLNWTATEGVGITDVKTRIRTADTPDELRDAFWTYYYGGNVTTSSYTLSLFGRWAQIEAALKTKDILQTPSLDSLDLGYVVPASVDTVIVDKGEDSLGEIPLFGFKTPVRFQALYLSSEVGQSGVIEKIYFESSNWAEVYYQASAYFCVKLGHTELNSLGETFDDNYKDTPLKVMEASPTIKINGSGWVCLDVEDTFYYNGTDNLIIEIFYYWGASTPSPHGFNFQGSAEATDRELYATGASCCEMGTLTTNIHNLKLEIFTPDYSKTKSWTTDEDWKTGELVNTKIVGIGESASVELGGIPSCFFIPTSTGTIREVKFLDKSSSGFPITSWNWDFGDGVGTSTTQNPTYQYVSLGNYTVTLTITNEIGLTDACSQTIGVVDATNGEFSTGRGGYPSIFGTHTGLFIPARDMTIDQLYTYSSPGTGGHSEYVAFYKDAELVAEANWTGYQGSYHYIHFDSPFTLEKDTIYTYEIKTGSYPQIKHTQNVISQDGVITCTKFVDANGKTYTDWLPAIILELSTAPSVSIDKTTAGINWTTYDAFTSRVDYGLTSSYGQSSPLDSKKTTSHSVKLTSLTPGITYHYRVRSGDDFGTVLSRDYTFTTLLGAAIFNSSLSSVTQNTAEFTWATDEVATTKVGYSTISGGPYTYVEDTTYTTSHRIALTGLSTGTTYYYVVISENPEGEEVTQLEDSFATLSGSDTTSPGLDVIPYQIKGVGYHPVPIGEEVEWDLEDLRIYNRDFPLIRDMKCNTIRTWGKVNQALLDKAAEYGLKVCAGFWVNPYADFYDKAVRDAILFEFKDYVATFKAHSALLMWCIGNEVDFHSGDNPAWYSLVNEMAKAAYEIEGATYHPVAVVNGDIHNIGDPQKSASDGALNYLDVWGTNSYRGRSFKDETNLGTYSSYFDYYAAQSVRPLWISEYGVDAWHTNDQYNPSDGYEDQIAQADWDANCLSEILAASDVCCGGTLMAYSDEWWKAGNPYNHDYGGSSGWGGRQPDGFSNEEWYGVMWIEDNGAEPDIMHKRQVYDVFAHVDPPPLITPKVPDIGVAKDTVRAFDLTPYEKDIKDGPGADGNSLTWSISGVNPSLFSSATIDPVTDVLTLTPVAGKTGTDEVTLTLTNSAGKTTATTIVANIEANNPPEIIWWSPTESPVVVEIKEQ